MPSAAPLLLIGYSGHAWVVADCWRAAGGTLAGYCANAESARNPYEMNYFGDAANAAVQMRLRGAAWFVAIGDNAARADLHRRLTAAWVTAPVTVRHPSAIVSSLATVGAGTLLAPLAVVNAGAQLGAGVICNTGAVVEHECEIGDFVHIAPGAVLAGGVAVGAGALVGAGAVVAPGIRIGVGALVGAGAVVVRDVPAGARVVGNPQRVLRPVAAVSS